MSRRSTALEQLYTDWTPAQENTLRKPPKEPADDTQAIATRAYELYQQRAHGESQQDQDWLEAVRKTHRDEAARKQTA
ncbi:MAG: DUF2934 domain-containing protein [Terracidiphilus sp.]|jgi:hypothetical protein